MKFLYIDSTWSSWLCSAMWRGPREYVAYEFVLTSPAMSYISGSSYLDSFRDGWSVAVQLLLCRVLSPGLFVNVHEVHKYSIIDTAAAWKKKLCFILSVRSDFHMTYNPSIAVNAFASPVLMSFLLMKHCFLGWWTCPLVSENYY